MDSSKNWGSDAVKEESVLRCEECGGEDFDDPEDGHYYCRACGVQSQDVLDVEINDEDVLGNAGESGLYSQQHKRKSQPQTGAPRSLSMDGILKNLKQALAGEAAAAEKPPPRTGGFVDEASEPQDFGGGAGCLDAGKIADGIRQRYVRGLQVMLQRQCEALVDRFGVSPLVCGLAGTVWLRYVAASRVFDERWADKEIAESEARVAGSCLDDEQDFSKDLPSYLKYCKDTVFAGRAASFEEERLMERLWNIYEEQQDNNKTEVSTKEKRPRDELPTSTSVDFKKPRGESQDIAVGNMKLNMEENGFHYLSPRSKQRNDGYLYYRRTRADGKLIYVAHSDYYILLRACARLARVDVRIMHQGVLKLEKKLEWTEQQISSSLG